MDLRIKLIRNTQDQYEENYKNCTKRCKRRLKWKDNAVFLGKITQYCKDFHKLICKLNAITFKVQWNIFKLTKVS